MKRLHHHSGFTLVELIIAIVIAGMLVSIAVPMYSHYTLTAKVREALDIMKGIKISQKVERAKASSFYTATGGAASTIFLEKGIDIRESIFFTYETTGDDSKFTVTATAIPETGAAGTISYDSAAKSWSCTGEILERMLPDSSE